MEEKLIGLENALSYLTTEELRELDEQLTQNDIHLITFESHGPKASLQDIAVFINSHITELILTGLIMPALYDVIKVSIKTVIFKIRGNVKILQSGKTRDAIPCLKFKTNNGEINVPIPSSLSEEQFERYMDEVKNAIEIIKPNPLIKYENFVVEQNEESLKIEVKTMLQYAQEQYNKQKNGRK